jgi:dipeptidyl-peptidase 4
VTQSLPRQLARTQRFTLGAPDNFTVAKDGARVLFLRSRAGDDPVSCLWVLETGSGAERLLADPAELLGGAEEDLLEAERSRRERDRTYGTGIVGYAADDAARLVAFALSGGLWTVDVTGGRVRRLPAAAGVVDPRPDPTGQRIAYVADGALRVMGADGSGDRALAEPDGPAVTFGLAEHVAAESMGRTDGYWWAPAGRRLLVARVDSAAVGLWYIGHPADPGKPPQAIRYPTAGTTNAEVTLWIIRLDGTRTRVRWDRDAFEYVPAAGWDSRGPHATVQSRDQRTMRWLGIDPDYGAKPRPRRPPASTPISTSTGSASAAGRSAARSPRRRCCAAPTSSAPQWPAPRSPTSGCTTRTGANGSSATPAGTRPGTTRARCCWTRRS